MTENMVVLDNSKLWDGILKAIVDAMPEQLFPLFREVYGKSYPKGTPITLLATESSTYRDDPNAPPGSRLSDIALLVNGTDYYHLECQMRNDKEMVIRMIAYDLHFAMQYTTREDKTNDRLTMYFPHSAVIYPAKNEHLPEFLSCRIIFQDGSEHIYRIPTVRIQAYSLEEIHQKHLTLFLPYVLLRLRPRLNSKRKFPLTRNELTDFIRKVILILEDEVKQGYLTDREFDDYISLIRHAAEKIFEKHAHFRKEVDRVTKPLIELPSVREKRLLAEKDAVIADKNAAIADKDAKLADKDAKLADKDAEIARMQALLEKYHIPVTS